MWSANQWFDYVGMSIGPGRAGNLHEHEPGQTRPGSEVFAGRPRVLKQAAHDLVGRASLGPRLGTTQKDSSTILEPLGWPGQAAASLTRPGSRFFANFYL